MEISSLWRGGSWAMVLVMACGDDSNATGDTEQGSGTGAATATAGDDSTLDAGGSGSDVDSGDGVTMGVDSTGGGSTLGDEGTIGDAGSTGGDGTTGDGGSTGTTSASGAPEIDVTVQATEVPSDGDFRTVSTVAVGATGLPLTITIDNLGTDDLAISGVTLQGPTASHWVLDTTGLATTVAAGDSTTFTVAFAPQNGGAKIVDVLIDSNDADEGSYVVHIESCTTPNTWRQLSPATSPVARYDHGMARLTDGVVLLNGGKIGTSPADATYFDDTWTFDIEAEDWTEVTDTAGTLQRNQAMMAQLEDQTVLLFGGRAGWVSSTVVDETWLYDGTTSTWSLYSPVVHPSARSTAGIDGGDGTIYLFGGYPAVAGLGNELGDLWVFDAASDAWTDQMIGDIARPFSAGGFASNSAGTLFFYGGFSSTGMADDGWTMDPSAPSASQSATVSAAVILTAVAFIDEDRAIKFGGHDPGPSAETTSYEPATDTWQALNPLTEPQARWSHAMVAVGGNKILLFGGHSNVGYLDDTWEYVGPWP